jgi:ubiquinone/menaquinone biosynthesis C-methylase UbiE
LKEEESNVSLERRELARTQPNWEIYYSTLKRIPRRLKNTAQFIADAVTDFQKHNFKRIVDLGCGAGRHSILLANAGFDVIGIDISKSALRLARQWAQKEKTEKIAFVRATMSNIPLRDSCTDAVISVSVIHHAIKKEIVTTVNEVHRILRNNGKFLANIASVEDPRHGTGRMVEKNTFSMLEAYEQKNFEELHHFFTKGEATSLLRRFNKKQVTATEEKPYYWEISAVK